MTNDSTEVKTPRERFLTVAPGRVQKVLDALDLLEKCGNAKGYEFREAEVDALSDAINEKVYAVFEAFQSKDVNPPPKFAFPEGSGDEVKSDGGVDAAVVPE